MPARDAPEELRTVDIQDLLAGARQIVILHRERRYILRITRQNKLILTRDESAGAPWGGRR